MPAERGVLNAEDRMHLLTYEQDKEGIERLVVSPSAIETYRSCPYKWFVERKLRLDDEGEAFGGREIGTFVHGVFQRFYEAWGASRDLIALLQKRCLSHKSCWRASSKNMQMSRKACSLAIV